MTEVPHSQVIFDGSITASGNTHSTPVRCRWSKEAIFFLNITAIAGNLDIEIQTKDSRSGEWHKLATFDTKSTLGTDEGFVDYGIGEQLAIEYETTGSATFSLNVYLKP